MKPAFPLQSNTEKTLADTAAPANSTTRSGSEKPGAGVRTIAVLLIIAGVVLTIAGIVTWFMIQQALADEKITVADDAAAFAGEPVDGPLTAFAQADIIEQHALKATGGKTYGQLDQEDPTREVVMTGSFLRASLFTSVVAFGVAAMAAGLGILVVLIGIALLRIARRLV
jgi:hypothetical protein